MPNQWYHRAYRRAVVDQHITDHDPRFLSQFDAAEYVRMLKRRRLLDLRGQVPWEGSLDRMRERRTK